MAIASVIFDVDGTLIDSNDLHAKAWHRALSEAGHEREYSEVRAHIGMGGDKLVASLLGQEVEEREGDQLRDAQARQFERLIDDPNEPKRAFSGVRELFEALRQRGLRLAIATSAERDKLEKLEAAYGVELSKQVDEVVSSSAVEESKPAPDLVHAALKKLGEKPERALMIGDTPYDAQACRAAGVACIGVRAGGWSDTLLTAAGALVTYADPLELLRDLDAALALAAQRGQ